MSSLHPLTSGCPSLSASRQGFALAVGRCAFRRADRLVRSTQYLGAAGDEPVFGPSRGCRVAVGDGRARRRGSRGIADRAAGSVGVGKKLEVVTIRGGRWPPQRADKRSRPDPVPGSGRADSEFHVPDRRRLFADHSVAGRLMSRLLTCLAALAAILAFSPASAHGGAHTEAAGWSSWFADPAVAIILAVAAVLYLGGLARMLSRPAGRWPVSKWRVVSFGCALGVIGLALLSPIDAFAERTFSQSIWLSTCCLSSLPPR